MPLPLARRRNKIEWMEQASPPARRSTVAKGRVLVNEKCCKFRLEMYNVVPHLAFNPRQGHFDGNGPAERHNLDSD